MGTESLLRSRVVWSFVFIVALVEIERPLCHGKPPEDASQFDIDAAAELIRTGTKEAHLQAAKLIRAAPEQATPLLSLMIENSDSSRIRGAVSVVLDYLAPATVLQLWQRYDHLDTILLRHYAQRVKPRARQKDSGIVSRVDSDQLCDLLQASLHAKRSRIHCLKAVEELGDGVTWTDPLRDAVIECLDDPTEFKSVFSCGVNVSSVRQQAEAVLAARMKGHAAELEPMVNQMLGDERSHRRGCAIRILAANRPISNSSMQRLLSLEQDPDVRIRVVLMRQLGNCDLVGADAIDVMLRMATGEHAEVAAAAAYGLSRQLMRKLDRSQCQSITDLLIDRLGNLPWDETSSERYRLKLALAKLDNNQVERAVRGLVPFLQAGNAVETAAVIAGGETKSRSGIEPVKTRLAAEESLRNRIRLARSLYAIENEAESVLPIYKQGLGSKVHVDIKNAAMGLREMGPAAMPLVDNLLLLLEESSPEHALSPSCLVAVLKTVGTIGPSASSAVPVLQKHITNEKSYVRNAAATAIRLVSGEVSASN